MWDEQRAKIPALFLFICLIIPFIYKPFGFGNQPEKHCTVMKVAEFSCQSENLAIGYVAPQVEVIEVEVEKGFAQSETEGHHLRDFNWD